MSVTCRQRDVDLWHVEHRAKRHLLADDERRGRHVDLERFGQLHGWDKRQRRELIVTTNAAVADGTSLTVCAGGVFILDAMVTGAPMAIVFFPLTVPLQRSPNRVQWCCWLRLGWWDWAFFPQEKDYPWRVSSFRPATEGARRN